MSAVIINIDEHRRPPSLFTVEHVVEAKHDIYSRLNEAVLGLEDMAAFMETLARQFERGNMERDQLIHNLRTGATAAKDAARLIGG